MRRLLGTVTRKAFSWLTGKFLAEVLVSAVATVTVTAVFSGSVLKSSPAVPFAAPRTDTGPAATEAARISFDSASLSPQPETFVAPARAHRIATIMRPQPATLARLAVPVPPPRPVGDQGSSLILPSSPASHATDGQDATRTPRPFGLVPLTAVPPAAEVPTASVPPAPVQSAAVQAQPAHHKGFTVFGVNPLDIVPSTDSIVGRVSSVGRSLADLAGNL